MILVVCGLVWWAVGFCGWCFWFTKSFDMDAGDMPVAVVVAFWGPITWLIGWAAHRRQIGVPPIILIRRQK